MGEAHVDKVGQPALGVRRGLSGVEPWAEGLCFAEKGCTFTSGALGHQRQAVARPSQGASPR